MRDKALADGDVSAGAIDLAVESEAGDEAEAGVWVHFWVP